MLSQFIDEASLDADLVQFGLNGELSLNDVKLNTNSAIVRALELPLTISAAHVQRHVLHKLWALGANSTDFDRNILLADSN